MMAHSTLAITVTPADTKATCNAPLHRLRGRAPAPASPTLPGPAVMDTGRTILRLPDATVSDPEISIANIRSRHVRIASIERTVHETSQHPGIALHETIISHHIMEDAIVVEVAARGRVPPPRILNSMAPSRMKT